MANQEKKQIELLEDILKQLQSSDSFKRRNIELAEERKSKRDMKNFSNGSDDLSSVNYQSRNYSGNNTLVDSLKNLPDTILKMFTGQAVNIPQAIIRQLTGALRPSNLITKPLNTLLESTHKLGDAISKSSFGGFGKPRKDLKPISDSIGTFSKESIESSKNQISSIESLKNSVNTRLDKTNSHLAKIAENSILDRASSGGYHNQSDYYRDLENTVGKERHNEHHHGSTSSSGRLENVGRKTHKKGIFGKISSAGKYLGKKTGSGVSKLFSGASKGIFGFVKKALNPMSWVRMSGSALKLASKIGLKAIPVIGWIFDIGSLLALVWDPVKKYLYEWAKDNPFATKVVQVLDSIVSPIVEFFRNIEKAVEALFSGDFSDVGEYLLRAFNGLKDFFKNIGQTAWAFIEPLGIVVSNIFKSVGNLFIDMFNFLRNKAYGALNTVIDAANKIPGVNIKHYTTPKDITKYQLEEFSADIYRQKVSDGMPTPPSYAVQPDGSKPDSDINSIGGSDYMGLAMHFESGKDFGAIGSIGELGAFQFDPRYDGFKSLISELQKNSSSFTDPLDKQLITELSSSSISSIMKDPSKKSRLQKILRSDLGVSLQKKVANDVYLKRQLEAAKKIKIGDRTLYDVAMENPRIKALLFSKALNQTSVIPGMVGSSYSDIDSFLDVLKSKSHSTWDASKTRNDWAKIGDKNHLNAIQSLHNRFDKEIAYAKGSGVDYTSPDMLNKVEQLSDSVEVARSEKSEKSEAIKEAVFSFANIGNNKDLVREFDLATNGKFSKVLNLPSSSNIKNVQDDKSIEKQQLSVLSAIHSSSVETTWDLDSLPYDSGLADLNRGVVV